MQGLGGGGELLALRVGEGRDRAVDADLVKELGHLLFRVAEGNGWTKDALSFNNLVTSWPDIVEVARESGSRQASQPTQGAFEFDEDE